MVVKAIATRVAELTVLGGSGITICTNRERERETGREQREIGEKREDFFQ